ncbi:MAG: HNH endonuclease family protein [Thermoleophilia bacterium]
MPGIAPRDVDVLQVGTVVACRVAARAPCVDHIGPLALAWRSGANGWDCDRREAFANDPANLLAVKAGLNRQKADKGREAWMPPAESSRATYAEEWTSIKSKYGLSVTDARRAALTRALEG